MKISAAGRFTKEELAKIVSEGKNYREVMITLGYTTPKGNSLTTFKATLDKNGIKHDHLRQWTIKCSFCGRPLIVKREGAKYHYKCQLKKYYQRHKEERKAYQNKYSKKAPKKPVKKPYVKTTLAFMKALYKIVDRKALKKRDELKKLLGAKYKKARYYKISFWISPAQWLRIIEIFSLKLKDCLALVEGYMQDRKAKGQTRKMSDELLFKMREMCIENKKRRRGKIWDF